MSRTSSWVREEKFCCYRLCTRQYRLMDLLFNKWLEERTISSSFFFHSFLFECKTFDVNEHYSVYQGHGTKHPHFQCLSISRGSPWVCSRNNIKEHKSLHVIIARYLPFRYMFPPFIPHEWSVKSKTAIFHIFKLLTKNFCFFLFNSLSFAKFPHSASNRESCFSARRLRVIWKLFGMLRTLLL